VKEKLQQVGLESSNLIIGVDFTKSNEWTGRHFHLVSASDQGRIHTYKGHYPRATALGVAKKNLS
jgi:hypothetical protein